MYWCNTQRHPHGNCIVVHAGPDLAFRIPDVEGCPPAQPMSELLAFMQHETQEAAKASAGMSTNLIGLLVVAHLDWPHKTACSLKQEFNGIYHDVCNTVMPALENGGVPALEDVKPAATPEQAKEPQRQEDMH